MAKQYSSETKPHIDRLGRAAEVEREKATNAATARDRFLLVGNLAGAETAQIVVETATATANRFVALADRLAYLTK